MNGKHITKEQYIASAKAVMPSLSDEHLANMWEHFFLIPSGKKDDIIPKGDYCYIFLKGQKNKFGVPKTKNCPFYKSKDINGVLVPWCEYLELGGVDDHSEEDWKRLVEFFGSEDATFDGLPLTLLFDMVKECGENKYTEEEIEVMYGESKAIKEYREENEGN